MNCIFFGAGVIAGGGLMALYHWYASVRLYLRITTTMLDRSIKILGKHNRRED